MFIEVLIIAGLGLASVVYGSRVKDQDAKTIGAGMVGAAIGVWTGARQQARNAKNGNGHTVETVGAATAAELDSRKDPHG